MTEAKAYSIPTIVFSVLLTCLTILSAWQLTVITEQNKQIKVQNDKLDKFPDIYVRLERYGNDMRNIQASIGQIQENLKLDIRSLSVDIKDLSKKIDFQFSIDRKAEKYDGK